MTTAAMKRTNTHGTTTLAGAAASGRGLLLPMPDTTTTTTHSLGGTPVGVVVVGTIAFYPSGGKCTPSRVRYEKRNPEVDLRNEYFRRVCRGFEVSYVPSVPRACGAWFFSFTSPPFCCFSSIFNICFGVPIAHCTPTASVSAAVALGPAVSCRRQRHNRAADGAPPPPGSCLMCTRCSRLCHPLVCICSPTCSSKRWVVFCSRCQAIDGQRADRLCRYPNDDLASGHLLLLGFPAPSPNPTAH